MIKILTYNKNISEHILVLYAFYINMVIYKIEEIIYLNEIEIYV